MNPVAIVDEDDEGLFVEILYGEDGSSLKRGDKLIKQKDLEEVKALLLDIQNGILHRGWTVGTHLYEKIDQILEDL